MSQIRILEKILKINPCQLTDIDKAINNGLKRAVKHDCSEEYGYIIKILDIISIDNKIMSGMTGIIFIVTFRAKTLKPERGSIFKGIITGKTSQGVFVTVKNRFKTIIAAIQSPNILSKKVGKRVKIQIMHMRFNKSTFECIGIEA